MCVNTLAAACLLQLPLTDLDLQVIRCCVMLKLIFLEKKSSYHIWNMVTNTCETGLSISLRLGTHYFFTSLLTKSFTFSFMSCFAPPWVNKFCEFIVVWIAYSELHKCFGESSFKFVYMKIYWCEHLTLSISYKGTVSYVHITVK